MPTTEHRTFNREQFLELDLDGASAYELAERLTGVDIDQVLIQLGRLGQEGSFEEHRVGIQAAIDTARDIAALPIDQLAGTSRYDSLRNNLRDLYGTFVSIANFNPNQGQPAEARGALANQLKSQRAAVLESFMFVAGYLLMKAGGIGDVQKQVHDEFTAWTRLADDDRVATQAELESIVASARADADRVREALQTAEAAAQATQKAAGTAGVAKYADVFEAESTRYATSARNALNWGVGGAVALAILTGLLVLLPTGGSDLATPRVVQVILLKSLIVGFGGYLVLLAFRLYRTREHLRVLNQHRHTALRTFEAFVEASEEPSTRDAVLIEATRAIFSMGATGLLSDEAGNSPMSILEVVRQLSPATPRS